jgi:type IV pilus assembly protein PilY1
VTSGGGVAVGQTITGSNVAAGTTVTALGTGTGGVGTYTVSVSQAVASTQLSNGASTLTVTAGNGIAVGQIVKGAGVATGTTITALVTGTGGPGTYLVSNSQSVASTQLTVGSSSGTAGIYVMLIDPGTGTQSVYYLDTGYGPSQDPTGQGRPNGIAYVTLADLDGDSTADYAYAGDLFGNLWRFDLTSNNPASWSASVGGAARPLFSAPSGRPITSKPIVWEANQASGGNQIIVIFGTGQENPITPVSPVTYATGTQSLYGVWDWDMTNWNTLSHASLANVSRTQYSGAYGSAPISASQLTAQTLTQVGTLEYDSNNTVCWYDGNSCTSFGWKIDLPGTGEQVIYNPTLWQGNLQVNTVIPSTSTVLSCTIQLPTGWTIMINPTTGGSFATSSFLGSNGSPMTVSGNPVAGMQLNATGSITNISAGGQSVGITQTVNNNPVAINEKAAPVGTGHRVTWTELR